MQISPSLFRNETNLNFPFNRLFSLSLLQTVKMCPQERELAQMV